MNEEQAYEILEDKIVVLTLRDLDRKVQTMCKPDAKVIHTSNGVRSSLLGRLAYFEKELKVYRKVNKDSMTFNEYQEVFSFYPHLKVWVCLRLLDAQDCIHLHPEGWIFLRSNLDIKNLMRFNTVMQ